MKKSILISAILISVILFSSFITPKPITIMTGNTNLRFDDDYRDQFIGEYEATIYMKYWDVYIGYTFDTIDTTVIVEKFLGYVAGNDSNFIDIEHKLGIIYGSYNTTYDDSWCGWTNYYTHGFLHPTVDTAGILSYPELTSCQNGNLAGFCDGDSIDVTFGNSNQWEFFERTIKGRKITNTIGASKEISRSPFVFPNPATNELYIKGVDLPTIVTIVDIKGTSYFSTQISNNKIDISKLDSGIYLLIFEHKGKPITLKFLKNNAR